MLQIVQKPSICLLFMEKVEVDTRINVWSTWSMIKRDLLTMRSQSSGSYICCARLTNSGGKTKPVVPPIQCLPEHGKLRKQTPNLSPYELDTLHGHAGIYQEFILYLLYLRNLECRFKTTRPKYFERVLNLKTCRPASSSSTPRRRVSEGQPRFRSALVFCFMLLDL